MDKLAAYDYLLKLLILGDSGVGKTCLLLRFSDDSFTTSHLTTIGIDFKIKTVEVDGRRVRLQLVRFRQWDTAGQERFRTLTQTYYTGAKGIVLVYDCGDAASFANVSHWMQQISASAGTNVVKVLIANKSDCIYREVATADGESLAAQYGMHFFEASAKTGANVREAFYCIAKAAVDSKLEDNGNSAHGVHLEGAKEKGKKAAKCCQ